MKGLQYALICAVVATLHGGASALAQETPAPEAGATRIVQFEDEVSYAHVEPARLDDQPGLAVIFEGTDDLHYYARSETAPAPGLQLKVEAEIGRAHV